MANRRPKTVLVKKASIALASSFLDTLPEKPKEELSLREAVDRLREPIRAALGKGYSYEEVAKLLADQGITISPSTLKNYVPSGGRQSNKEKAATPGTRGRRSKKTADESTADAEAEQPLAIASPTEAEPKKRNKVESVVEELLSAEIPESADDDESESESESDAPAETPQEEPAPAKRGRRPGRPAGSKTEGEPKSKTRTAAKAQPSNGRRSRSVSNKVSAPARSSQKPATRGRKKREE